MTGGWRPVACLLTIALSMVGATACGGSQPSEGGSAASSHPASPSVLRQVPKRLRAEFALFRSAPEGLPLGVLQVLAASSTYGVNGRLAQVLPGAPWPAWLIPGRGFVCLAQQETPRSGIGQTCAPTREVLKSGTFITTLSAKATQRVVLGVVPDGTRAVRVYTPKSATALVTVSRNVFDVRDRAPGPPETIALVR
jgi:hypothetical protein